MQTENTATTTATTTSEFSEIIIEKNLQTDFTETSYVSESVFLETNLERTEILQEISIQLLYIFWFLLGAWIGYKIITKNKYEK